MVIDPIRSSESKNIGVDQRYSSVARKGDDGNIYFPVRNRKTGKNEYINAIKMSQSIVGFPIAPKLQFSQSQIPINPSTMAPVAAIAEPAPEQGAAQYLNI
jgi:hypothetical protein